MNPALLKGIAVIGALGAAVAAVMCLPSKPVDPTQPTPIPEPTATPCPTHPPCPTPPPPEPPKPGLFNAPDIVPAETPFAVTLCKPFEPNIELHADSYKLGTFGHHRRSGCMMILVPSLNTVGTRTLKAAGLERQIIIWDAKTLTSQ